MTEIHAGPDAISLGVERLSRGLLVAFPTETVYGLGGDALDPDAVARVFALKGRPSTNPLIVHVSGIEMAKSVVSGWSADADLIAKAHWPGAVTIILPKAGRVPSIVCAGGPSVAVRCPAHPCALALIESFAKPIVGPSANPSGRISPTTPEHVADGFPDADLIVIDGGHCRAGIESTVVDLSGDRVRVLRLGIVGAHMIAETIGREVVSGPQPIDGSATKSPGLVGAHYQPSKPARLVESGEIGSARASTALIAWSIETHPNGGVLVSIPNQIEQYAGEMYKALHDADRTDADAIWIEHPPSGSSEDEQSIRGAVMERLTRATHP